MLVDTPCKIDRSRLHNMCVLLKQVICTPTCCRIALALLLSVLSRVDKISWVRRGVGCLDSGVCVHEQLVFLCHADSFVYMIAMT